MSSLMEKDELRELGILNSKIHNSCEPVELSLIASQISKQTSEMRKDRRINTDYDYFLKYSYLLKLQNEATKAAIDICNQRMNCIKSHL